MRRETKAGLVVTCSFLALLGVVIFCKYRRIDLDRAAGLASAAAAEVESGPLPAASVAVALGAERKPPSGVVQAGHQEMQPVKESTLPLAPAPAEPKPKAEPPPPEPKPPAPSPPPVPEPPSPPAPSTSAPAAVKEQPEDPTQREKGGAAEKEGDKPEAPRAEPEAPPPPPPPAAPSPPKEEAPAPPPEPTNRGEKSGKEGQIETPEKATPDTPPPPPPPAPASETPKPEDNPVPLPKPEEIGVPPAPVSPPEPAPPAIGAERPGSGVRLESPRVVPVGATSEPMPPKPPVGAPAAAVSPPIVVPAPGAAVPTPARSAMPQVESFDEETYRCKAGETFATISKQKYLTENYARALLVYNRNHPQAADGVRQEPPVLANGTMVFIPPVSILEKRYASMIPNLTPIAPPSPPPAATVSNARPPRSAAAPSGAGSGAAATYPQYRVVGRSERMWEIARKALGNSDRWAEIYKLNQNYRAEFPIPGGAVLRLPMDARVPAENAPQ